MFRKEDILIVKSTNVSSKGLQQAMDQVADLYEQGYRLARSDELDNYSKARLAPWRIAMVRLGTKTIAEINDETPSYINERFLELPDNPTKEMLNAFCTKYLLEVDESKKQPISRYQKTIRTILAQMMQQDVPEETQEDPSEDAAEESNEE